MQKKEGSCEVCDLPSTKRCSRCQAVYYCSAAHQKLHWKTHSHNCEPCKLVKKSQIGTHYIATRNINVGEAVLYDKVLITGPHYARIIKVNGDMMERSTPPVCAGCYNILTVDNAMTCNYCGWPLCFNCKKHGAECDFTVKYRKSKVTITEYGESNMAYEAIAVIRGLALRDYNPKAYQRLLNLKDRSPKLEVLTKMYASPKEVAHFVKSFFNHLDVEEEVIAKIYEIQLINMYVLSTSRPPHFAVYDRVTCIENSCRANCSRSHEDNGNVVIWAAVPIFKGDHITACYADFRWGNEKRRTYLSETKCIDCKCERCKDPTEFGLMLNAFKCTKKQNCSGYMLPPTFLVTGDNYPDYVCSECNEKESWHSIKALEEEIETHWLTVNTTDLTQCRKFLDTWQKILHENHHYNFDIELEILYIASCKTNLEIQSDEQLADLIKSCEKILNIVQTLAPAQHVLRGSVMYLKVAAASVVFDRNEFTNFETTYTHIKDTKDVLNEVHVLLHRESGKSFSTLLEKIIKNIGELRSAEEQIKQYMETLREGTL